MLLLALPAFLFWLAFFTRGDGYHWPGFFAAMAFMPLVMVRIGAAHADRRLASMLVAISLACTTIVSVTSPLLAIPGQMASRIAASLHNLANLGTLHDRYEMEWRQIAASSALPRIAERVGTARIDMVTWEQGTVLVNGFNYAPRPVFQSYAAYTPALARLNEAYFLGADAPEFVLFRLDYTDGRLPMSEDGLALIALLRRYRPVAVEKGFLLLQKDAEAKPEATILVGAPAQSAPIGVNTAIAEDSAPTIAFVGLELSAFGRIYTLLFREPPLDIVLTTSTDQEVRYRLTRPTAAAGFLLNPFVQSTHDWIARYLSQPLPRIRAVRVEAHSMLEQLLFGPDYSVAAKATTLLAADPARDSAEMQNALYPGFTLPPTNAASLRVIEEDGSEAVHLHAPATLAFKPESGNYDIYATFGVQAAARNDPDCIHGNANGVGVSFVRISGGAESVLWHVDIDPFHSDSDRGPHRAVLTSVDVAAGDAVEYRVDPGPDPKNVACDWTYVRNLVFRRNGAVGTIRPRDRISADHFD
jgi:hypothetical protein